MGTDFEIALRSRASEGVIHAMGLAGASGGRFDLLLLHDVTESAAEISLLSDRWERLRRVLDTLPVPVWCRNAALEIIDCNAAYAHAVDAASPEAAIAESREITGGGPPPARSLADQARAAGETRTGTYRVVIEGARRMLDLTETPLGQGAVSVGYALDQTGLAEARTELARHVAAHADVLEHLGTAIVIYGPDRRVKFFNSAFAKLWHLDEPTLGDPARDGRGPGDAARAAPPARDRGFPGVQARRGQALHLAHRSARGSDPPAERHGDPPRHLAPSDGRPARSPSRT